MEGGIVRLGGIVIGFLLAIAVAYVHDAAVAPRSADGQVQYLVNWEVLGRATGEAGSWLRDQFDRLLAEIHHHD